MNPDWLSTINKNSSIVQAFLNTIEKFQLLDQDVHVLIALSGGADSVALLILFLLITDRFNLRISAIHINHLLRGKESDRDALFCQELCRQVNIPLYSRSVDVKHHAQVEQISIEMAARELRYQVFEDVSREAGCERIATAHHFDDQVETVLMRLFKGTGVYGLRGIPVFRNQYIRPLLHVYKSEIIQFLSELDIPYMSDSTNFVPDYERNYIRNEVVPIIEKKFPMFKKKLGDLTDIIALENSFWQMNMDNLWQWVDFKNERLFIDKKVFEFHKALVFRFMRHLILKYFLSSQYLNAQHLEIIYQFRDIYQGNRILVKWKDLRITSSYHHIIVEKAAKNFQNHSKYVKIEDNFAFYYGSCKLDFRITKADQHLAKKVGSNTCFIYVDSVEALIIRRRENGDRVRISEDHNRKLKDWFIDSKFADYQRTEAIIIEVGGRIACVYVPDYGFRVFHDFYVKPKSIKMLRIIIKEDFQ